MNLGLFMVPGRQQGHAAAGDLRSPPRCVQTAGELQIAESAQRICGGVSARQNIITRSEYMSFCLLISDVPLALASGAEQFALVSP
jgi:hypothetical protein